MLSRGRMTKAKVLPPPPPKPKREVTIIKFDPSSYGIVKKSTVKAAEPETNIIDASKNDFDKEEDDYDKQITDMYKMLQDVSDFSSNF